MINQAINSPQFVSFLHELNGSFFNVKQERNIRDFLVNYINKNNNIFCYSEEPRDGSKKADFQIEHAGGSKTIVEMKYQYRKDLRYKKVRNPIIEDIGLKTINGIKCDIFLLIIHSRPGVHSFKSNSSVSPLYPHLDNEKELWKSMLKLCKEIKRVRPYKKLHRYASINIHQPFHSQYDFIGYEF